MLNLTLSLKPHQRSVASVPPVWGVSTAGGVVPQAWVVSLYHEPSVGVCYQRGVSLLKSPNLYHEHVDHCGD